MPLFVAEYLGHLKAERCGDVRITKYKKDALRTLPASLGATIETALDKEYSELFNTFLTKLREESEDEPG